MIKITASYVREILDYDPETGIFLWKKPRPKVVVGMKAGWVKKNGKHLGRIEIMIDGRTYQAPRVAWLHYYGRWPKGQIDHADLNKSNNRISNLREATGSQNQANRTLTVKNTSGLKGASFKKSLGRWVAQISHTGRVHHLGVFDTPEEAHAAYVEAATRFHGEFARVA